MTDRSHSNVEQTSAEEKATDDLTVEVNLEKVRKVATELMASGRLILRLANAFLELVTDWLAAVSGSRLVGGSFHLLLSALLLLGPLLSLQVSKYSIFSNPNHFLYR